MTPIYKINEKTGEQLDYIKITSGIIQLESFEINPSDERITPFFQADVSGLIEDKDTNSDKVLTGRITLLVRNYTNISDFAILISLEDFTAKVDKDIKTAKIITIILQYLWDMLDRFVIEIDVKTAKGESFIVPPFQYSEGLFENDFPH